MTDYDDMTWPNVGLMGLRTEVRRHSFLTRMRQRLVDGIIRRPYEVALLTRGGIRFILMGYEKEEEALRLVKTIEEAGSEGVLLEAMGEFSKARGMDFLRPLKANVREAQQDYAMLLPGDVAYLRAEHDYQDVEGMPHTLPVGKPLFVKDVLFDADHTVIAQDGEDDTYTIPAWGLDVLVPGPDRDGREHCRTYILTADHGWQRLENEVHA